VTTPQEPGSPDPQPPQYGAPPPAYGAPQFGAPPPAYGAPQYGAPPPGYGAQPPGYGAQPPGYGGAAYGGNQLAHWGWRALGYLIDLVIVAIPSAIIGVATGSRPVYDILAFAGAVTIAYLNGAQGQSPGKRIVGIKVLRESDGQLIGGGMGIVRTLAHLLDSLSCLIGWFWPLWDDKKQTFADKVIGTVVIKL
jgi:RDD family